MATILQKKAIKRVLEKRGKSVSGAMRDVGYSEATSKNPSNLTDSKAFRDFFGKTFTQDYLTKQHKQLANLKSLQQISVDPDITETEAKAMIEAQGFGFMTIRKWTETDKKGNEREKALMLFTAPDGMSKKAALDMAYKLLGRYAQLEGGTGTDPLAGMTLEELDEKLAELEDFTKRAKQFRKLKKRNHVVQ